MVSRDRPPFLASVVVASLLGLTLSKSIQRPVTVERPEIDYSLIQSLEIYGSFTGLTEYDYVGANSVAQIPSSNSSIFVQGGTSPNHLVSNSLANGLVSSSCMLGDNKTLVLAGNFTSVRDVAAEGLATIDLSTGDVTNLDNVTLSGLVNTLYCNGSLVWVGGDFKLLNGSGVGVWDNDAKSWSAAPFGGFTKGGIVNSILPFGESLLFAGQFAGLNEDYGVLTTSNGTNSTVTSSSFKRKVGLAGSTITTSSSKNYTDPSNLRCGSGDAEWVAEPGSKTTAITLDVGRTIYPTEIELQNLANSVNGTKMFRLISTPANGIMNLSRTDSSTGETTYCDAWCTLDQNSDATFEFVNVIETTKLEIILLDYYGTQAGLEGINIYTESAFVYADEATNSGLGCQAITAQGSSSLEGNWELFDSDYEVATINTAAEFLSTSSSFEVNTEIDGSYIINLYTPGCLDDKTCSSRGMVNVTVNSAKGVSTSLTLYQTNQYLKYDQIFSGDLSWEDNFVPNVVVTPVAGQKTPFTFVSFGLSYAYNGTLSDEHTSKTNLTIRNLFEYSPANFSNKSLNSSTEVGNTTINRFGLTMGNSDSILSLASANDTLYLAYHSSNSSGSLYSYDGSSFQSLSIGDVDASSKLISFNQSLYYLSSNGVYSLSNKSSRMLYSSPASSVVPFFYDNLDLLAFTSNSSSQASLDLYNPRNGTWYSSMMSASLYGHVEASYSYAQSVFYIGSVRVVNHTTGGLYSTSANTSTTSRYSLVTLANLNSASALVLAGTSVNSSCSFFGGQFPIESNSNETTNYGLVAISNKTIKPIKTKYLNESTLVYSLGIANSTLIAAGNFSSDGVSGVLLYDLSSSSASTTQPSGLSNYSADTLGLVVASDNSSFIVYGDLQGPNGSGCNGFCQYDLAKNSWLSPSGKISLTDNSTVSDAALISSTEVMLIGNFTIANGTTATILTYNLSSHELSQANSRDGSMGTATLVSTMFLANDTSITVAGFQNSTGETNLKYLYNSMWLPIDTPFTSGSQIDSIGMLPAKSLSSSLLGSNRMLTVSGLFSISGYGQISMAVYNGTAWIPYYIASDDSGYSSISSMISARTLGTFTSTGVTSTLPSLKEDDFMSVGDVVGVSCAVAVGCVCLLIVLGLLWSWYSQKRTEYSLPAVRAVEKGIIEAAPPPEVIKGMY